MKLGIETVEALQKISSKYKGKIIEKIDGITIELTWNENTACYIFLPNKLLPSNDENKDKVIAYHITKLAKTLSELVEN